MFTKTLGVTIELQALPLPLSVDGVVARWHADDYTIVLNIEKDITTARRALEHELFHIICRDFDSDLSADELEAIRHRQLDARWA